MLQILVDVDVELFSIVIQGELIFHGGLRNHSNFLFILSASLSFTANAIFVNSFNDVQGHLWIGSSDCDYKNQVIITLKGPQSPVDLGFGTGSKCIGIIGGSHQSA